MIEKHAVVAHFQRLSQNLMLLICIQKVVGLNLANQPLRPRSFVVPLTFSECMSPPQP